MKTLVIAVITVAVIWSMFRKAEVDDQYSPELEDAG